MSILNTEKKFALNWIEKNSERFSDFHQLIWKYAETSLREYKSCEAYVQFHKEEEFKVIEGIAGMPTAYLAVYGEGKPIISTYTEYDAVPEASQDPVPYRKTSNPWQAGHTDPHSALGVGALLGACATKNTMKEFNLKGTLKVFGTPAEKICVAKPYQAAKGYYDDLDACVAWHPRNVNSIMYETSWGSYWCVAFIFICDEPEKWFNYSDLPMQARCPGALDAVCLMYTTTKYTKEGMLPHTGSWSINEAILVAGQATADNIPPKLGIITYAWRSSSLAQQEQIWQVLLNNAESAAKATGCNVTPRWVTKTRTGLFNKTLADLAYDNLNLIGPPKFTDEDKEKAREILRNLGYEPVKEPYNERLTPPEEYEEQRRSNIPPHQKKSGSDDYVEFSWHCPTVWIQVYVPSIRVPGVRLPPWTHYALCGMKGVIDKSIITAGKTISGTMLDLIIDPKKLGKCKEEHETKISEYNEKPLLSQNLEPPIDLPWPEYVSTVRGYEWHVGSFKK
jgi:aminobenzoyl-glutamate utilization protein B